MADEALVQQDLPKAIVLLNSITQQVTDVTQHVQKLIQRVKDGEIRTSKGISFLEVKFQLMLSYLINLSQFILKKTHGDVIEGSPLVERLVEIRTVLEKIRPIDQKLKYQVDKLIKTSATGHIAADDPLRLKPNPGNMASKLDGSDDDSESEDETKDSKPKAYVPPRLTPMHYDGDETEKTSQQKNLEKAKKRVLSGNLMKELRAEYDDGPEEIQESRDLHKIKADKNAKDRNRYEEDNFMRLIVSKKEKHKMRKVGTVSNLDELTHFGDLSALVNEDDYTLPSKKKKRGAAKKGKSKGKKKFRRN